jgi:hypothetical protein
MLPPWPFPDLRGVHDGVWCHDVTRSPSHSYSSFAFRVYPEPSRHGPSPAPCARLPAHQFTRLVAVSALPWSFSPFSGIRCGKRPTPGLPHPAVLRPQAFSASRRVIPPSSCRPYFMPTPPRFPSSEVCSPVIASCALRRLLPLLLFPSSVLRPHHRSCRDWCTHVVRASQVGVTRTLLADPLLTFTPSRFPSLGLGALAGASSHGLQHAASLQPKPSSVVVPALQSFKEPRG